MKRYENFPKKHIESENHFVHFLHTQSAKVCTSDMNYLCMKIP